MVAHPQALNQAGHTDHRAWIQMIGLSMLFHVLFLFGIVFLPEIRFATPHTATVVEVDLVNLPLAGPQGPPLGGVGPIPQVEAEAPPAEPIKEAEVKKPSEQVKKPKETRVEPKAPAPQETVSLAPKQLEVKKSLKKKTYDASKVISKAIAEIETQAPESRPRSVVQAIDRLKKEVQGGKGVGGTGAGVGTTVGTPSGMGTGKKALELLDIYHAEIWHVIQKNWAFSEELAQGRMDLQAVINVKIMKDGKIQDIWFEKRSGNGYFDDSALKAVKKSDPLPPLPEPFPDPFYEVGFRFNLSEMKRKP